MADKLKANESEMIKWLDVLLEFDPTEDAQAVELLSEDVGDLEMHEADADGALNDEKEQ